jgi:NAD+ synthase
MTSIGPPDWLALDEARTQREVGTELKRILEHTRKSAFIIGLSGGIDSALLAALIHATFGPASLTAAYLHDRDSDPRLAHNARSFAQTLGITLLEHDIDAAMAALGIYEDIHFRLTASSSRLNRMLHRAYQLFMGEPPFVSSLRYGSGDLDRHPRRKSAYEAILKPVETAFNVRHIHRREWLEQYARHSHLALVGAANRTEWHTGWFVPGGVDDLPHQPLIGLYKTQVRQIARWLQLPTGILERSPSPDMMRGIGDAFALGLPYWKIDLILDHLAGGLTQANLLERGIRPKEVEHIRTLGRLSAWKRSPPQASPSVTGGPGSALRRYPPAH